MDTVTPILLCYEYDYAFFKVLKLRVCFFSCVPAIFTSTYKVPGTVMSSSSVLGMASLLSGVIHMVPPFLRSSDYGYTSLSVPDMITPILRCSEHGFISFPVFQVWTRFLYGVLSMVMSFSRVPGMVRPFYGVLGIVILLR